jgi:hypothetical protein
MKTQTTTNHKKVKIKFLTYTITEFKGSYQSHVDTDKTVSVVGIIPSFIDVLSSAETLETILKLREFKNRNMLANIIKDIFFIIFYF